MCLLTLLFSKRFNCRSCTAELYREHKTQRRVVVKVRHGRMMPLHTRNALRVNPNNIPRVAIMLRRIGFADPVFQGWRVGQRFGVSRPLTDLLEWHIQGFADGAVDSHVEVSRKRLQHIVAKPGSYYLPLMEILRRYGIPFRFATRILPDAAYLFLPEPFGRIVSIQVPGCT